MPACKEEAATGLTIRFKEGELARLRPGELVNCAVKECEPGEGSKAVMEALPLMRFATPRTVEPS